MKKTKNSELVGKMMSYTGREYCVGFKNDDGADIVVYPATKLFVVLRVIESTNKLVCCDILCSDGRIGSIGVCWQEIEFAK